MNREARRRRVKTGISYNKDGRYLGRATKKGFHKGCSGKR